MSFGLKCWDAAGQVTLDITSRITRLYAHFSVTFEDRLVWHAFSVKGMAPDGTWCVVANSHSVGIRIENGQFSLYNQGAAGNSFVITVFRC